MCLSGKGYWKRSKLHIFSTTATGMRIKKLALGTVQFGLDYGIANERGKVPKEEVFKILDLALEKGIDTLDTARSYGDAERVLGEYPHIDRFKVVTKFSEKAQEDLWESLRALKLPKVYGLLAHKTELFLKDPSRWDEVLELRYKGLSEKIGFSLYFPWELEKLWDLDFDIVQVPYNVLDRRFEGYFPKLKERGVEIHTRSAFLQGLLLIEPKKLKPFFKSVKPVLEELRVLVHSQGVGLKDLLLCFCLNNPHVDKVVVGVDSLSQFIENLSVDCNVQIDLPEYDLEERFLVPFMWEA